MVRLDLVLKAGKMEGEETGDGVGDERGEHGSFGFVVSANAGIGDRNDISVIKIEQAPIYLK